ncbi:MAG TPA: YncE family protein [Tepidisphaeraceae bacterium]|nr:YncE family protein [Tepidisphaeraceae bacterium]
MLNRLLLSLVGLILCGGTIGRAGQTLATSLLVLNKGDLTLAIVDPVTLKVVARVASGPDPHEVIAAADGKLAFISNYGGFGAGFHTLSVVDLVAQKPLPAVDLGALTAPHGLAQARGKIYFTAEKSKVIGRYDPGTHKIDWVLGIGQNRTHMLVVTRDARRIITSNVNSNTISIIEPGGGQGPPRDWNVTNIPVGHGPEGFDLSPDGKEVWAANSHDGTVSVIEIASKSLAATLNIPTRRANRLKFTPDGKRVLISDISGTGVVVVDVASRKELKRIDLGAGAAGILMQPDGARAYVSAGDGVSVIDLKTLDVSARIASGHGPDGLAWAVRK